MNEMMDTEAFALDDNAWVWRRELIVARCVTAADVARLRMAFPCGLPTRSEVEDLFQVERLVDDRCPEWAALFGELVIDYVVWGERPTGVIREDQADWILGQIRRTPTDITIAVGLAIADEAHAIPHWFRAAANAWTTRALKAA